MVIKQVDKNQIVWQNKILPCQVGRNGFTNTKYEGDGCTPTGNWQLLTVYYRPDRLPFPQTVFPVISITPDMGWSDDPSDPSYNLQVKLPYNFSHEALWRDDYLYDIFITTSYNTNPVVPGQGSAIFIHQMHEAQTPTAGCLALQLTDLNHIIATASLNTYRNVGEELARIT